MLLWLGLLGAILTAVGAMSKFVEAALTAERLRAERQRLGVELLAKVYRAGFAR